MIDWITAKLPCIHAPINGGMVVSVDQDGEVEWMTSKFVHSEGSYSSKVQFRSDGAVPGERMASHIFFHGNPSKYLQGHNLFGSDDIISLMLDTYLKICAEQGIVPNDIDLQKVKNGDYTLSRVDFNRSYELPCREDVRSWIRAGEYSSKTRHGATTRTGGTLYYGKKSSRWTIKIYSKGDEIDNPKKKYKFPEDLKSFIGPWADNKLRVELTLRGKELDELGLKIVKELTPSKLDSLYNDYIGRIKMSKQMHLSDSVIFDLPNSLRNTYVMWRDGYDVKNMLSKPTFYRHRKALLTGWSIDITLAVENSGLSNVIPLLRVLEAVPAPIPTMAFQYGLVHHSAKQVASND